MRGGHCTGVTMRGVTVQGSLCRGHHAGVTEKPANMCAQCCCTHNEDGHKAGGDDDPVSIAVVSSFPHQNAIEDEVPQTQLEPSS